MGNICCKGGGTDTGPVETKIETKNSTEVEAERKTTIVSNMDPGIKKEEATVPSFKNKPKLNKADY